MPLIDVSRFLITEKCKSGIESDKHRSPSGTRAAFKLEFTRFLDFSQCANSFRDKDY